MEGTMTDRDRRFFLKVPPGYFDMTEEEQQAATRTMWTDAMAQLGEDPDRRIGERATAQDENTDDGHGL
jgi:hypothetical protein